jgi:hypothetical protein
MKSIQTADVEFINNLPQELINAVGTYREKGRETEDTRLYARKNLDFRQIVDRSFPTMLIIDYADIEKELKKYQVIGPSLKQALGDRYDPKFEKDFKQSKLTDSEIAYILEIIKSSVQQFITKCESITQKGLIRALNTTIQYELPEKTVLNALDEIFIDTFYLSDVSTPNREVFIYRSFDSIGASLTNIINTRLSAASTKTVNSIGELLNFGHTATGYQQDDEIVVQFNSPKLINIIFDVITNTSADDQGLQAATAASVNFVQQSGQVEDYITIDKSFSDGFLKVFVKIGGNIVKFENAVINQYRGSVVERTTSTKSDSKTLQKLAQLIKATGSGLGSRIARLLTRGRSSASILDFIATSIMSAIKGETVKSFKQTVSTKKITKFKNKVPIIVGFTKGTKKIKLPRVTEGPPKPLLSDKVKLESSLINLKNLLDSNLVQTVKQNMGAGNRRDVLNLRSGRFAESVRVERLTQGRSGMVTAYYNYMRNPYGTFSQGGRQERPRSRDPKLLISKSIREVAAQAKITRLRAVLV